MFASHDNVFMTMFPDSIFQGQYFRDNIFITMFTSPEALPLCTCAALKPKLRHVAHPQLASLEPKHCHRQ